MNTPPKIAFACPMLWEKMQGNDTTRFCQSCGHHVYNLSALNDHQRAELIARARTEKICGTYQLRLNGELVTPEKPLTPRERLNLKQVGLAALSAGALALATGCMSTPVPTPAPVLSTEPTAAQSQLNPDEDVIVLMGGIFCSTPDPFAPVRNYERK